MNRATLCVSIVLCAMGVSYAVRAAELDLDTQAACVDVGKGPDTIDCSDTTYLPRGYRWVFAPNTAVSPAVMQSVTIRLQPDGPSQSNLPADTALDAFIEQSVPPWTEANCADNARPNLRIVEGSPYPNHDTGDNQNTGVFNNVVYWESNTNPLLDTATLAITPSLYYPSNGLLVSADLVYNKIDFRWRVDDGNGASVGCTTSVDTNCYDLVTVGLHEMGHFVGLGHVRCSGSVMVTTAGTTSIRHALSAHDKAGVCAIYPPRPSSTASRATGELCRTATQCPTGNTCLWPDGASPSNSPNEDLGICVESCTSHAACDAGYRCQRTEDESMFWCNPGLVSYPSTLIGYKTTDCASAAAAALGGAADDNNADGNNESEPAADGSGSSTGGCACDSGGSRAPSVMLLWMLVAVCVVRSTRYRLTTQRSVRGRGTQQ